MMNEPLNTSALRLQQADWDRLEADVVTGIRALRAIVARLEPDKPLTESMAKNLIMPNLELLAEFCNNVSVEVDDGEDE